jgi:ribosome maturation factor RimP
MPPTFFCFGETSRKYMRDAIEDIVIHELVPLGLELFELRTGGSKGRPVLDVRIDRADGQPVTIDDCARASRAIEARLDSMSYAGTRYVLEVSSPGLERPLRNASDWRRFVGRDAVLTSDAVADGPAAGSREVRIAGVEGDAGTEVIVVKDGGGNTLRIPLAAVKKARLAFNWNR